MLAQQAGDRLRASGIPGKYSVRPTEPQVAGNRNRVLGEVRDLVRPVVEVGIREQVFDLSFIEAGQLEVEVEPFQFLKFGPEELEVPIRLLVAEVVHQSVRFDLSRRQIIGYVDWRLFKAQLFRREQSGVPADNYKILVNDDCLAPAKFLYRRGDFVDRSLRNLPAVTGVGDYFLDFALAHL